MQKLLSSSNETYVSITDVLEITLEESPNTNYKWELTLPDGLQTLKSIYIPTPSTLLHTWLIAPTFPGRYIITCHYRRMCCSRAIKTTKSYVVIVDN